jgi:hypothetical protein
MCTYTRAVFACHHEKWGSRTRECAASERLKRESLPFACQIRDSHERLSTKVPRPCGRCQATDRALRAVREKLAECRRLFDDKFRGYSAAHAASDNVRDERDEVVRWSIGARAKEALMEEDEDEEDDDEDDNQDESIKQEQKDKVTIEADITPCFEERQDTGLKLLDKPRSSTVALTQDQHRGENPESASLMEDISSSGNEKLVKSPQRVQETSQSTHHSQPDIPHPDGIITSRREVLNDGVKRHPETLHVVGHLLAMLHSYNAKSNNYVAEKKESTHVSREATSEPGSKRQPTAFSKLPLPASANM